MHQSMHSVYNAARTASAGLMLCKSAASELMDIFFGVWQSVQYIANLRTLMLARYMTRIVLHAQASVRMGLFTASLISDNREAFPHSCCTVSWCKDCKKWQPLTMPPNETVKADKECADCSTWSGKCHSKVCDPSWHHEDPQP